MTLAISQHRTFSASPMSEIIPMFWISLDSNRLQVIQLTLLTLTTLFNQIMAKPLSYASSRSLSLSSLSSSSESSSNRINPCNLPFYFAPTKTAIPDPYEKVYRRAKAMKGCTERVRRHFIQMLGDEDFEAGLSNLRQDWLPEISNSIEDVDSIEENDAFRKSFQYLQYFAVGLEQIILDQALHEGHMVKEFREIEEHLSQLLCEIQLGMWYRDILPDNSVGTEVMAQEYRDIGDASRRLIRDYLLLRDLVKLTDYIVQLFFNLKSRT